jgi:hypothetical protein
VPDVLAGALLAAAFVVVVLVPVFVVVAATFFLTTFFTVGLVTVNKSYIFTGKHFKLYSSQYSIQC